MARFFLMLDGVRILTLDDLKAHFKPLDALDRFRHGALQRWLAEQHLDDLLHKVEAIDEPSDDATIRALGTVFGLANYTEESLGTLDETLCDAAATDEVIKGLFEGPDGEHNLFRLEELANDGNVEAQKRLAYMYMSGLCVSMDDKKAFQWYLKAANQGDAFAQWSVGTFLQGGVGTELDYEKAFGWFLKAANQRDADAQVEVGKAFAFGTGVTKNDKKAREWFAKAAAQDNPEGLYWHGLVLNDSTNGNDHKEAVRAFERAAELGHSEACDMLGDCYQKGDGVKEDAKAAVDWFRKAAERGSADGMFHLGKCHYHGNGVKENNTQAVKWFREAIEKGNVKAKTYLGNCYLYGHGVKESNNMALKLFLEAAEEGDTAAKTMVGRCYNEGWGTEVNYAKAAEWFQKAADQGDVQAQGYLGGLLLFGEGIEQDEQRGFRMIRSAAEALGDDEFQSAVGLCLENGLGVAKDTSKAAKWYKLAADQGNEEAAKRYRICTGQAGFFETLFS